MIDESSLLWTFGMRGGWFLLVIACEAIPNEDYEVEIAVYAGRQCSKEIVWVESYAVDCTLEDVDELAALAYDLSECSAVVAKAKCVACGTGYEGGGVR